MVRTCCARSSVWTALQQHPLAADALGMQHLPLVSPQCDRLFVIRKDIENHFDTGFVDWIALFLIFRPNA